MKLHDLQPRSGATKRRKRVGRGISAGQGKTAGRGTKGYGARAGSGGKLYRQGGNLPFFRRLPFKRGFTNINRKHWQQVSLEKLADLKANTDVTPQSLLEAGILKDLRHPVVILGQADLKVPLKVKVHRVTSGAQAKIEAAGGSIEILEA